VYIYPRERRLKTLALYNGEDHKMDLDLTCEERPSASPFVDRVWRSEAGESSTFTSMAETHCGLVVTRLDRKTIVTVRGPEIRATPAYGPEGAEFVGIVFKMGTFIRHIPASMVMDRNDLNLPEASCQSFWLHGATWEVPNFENIDTFIDWLARDGLLVHDPLVDAVLNGTPPAISQRTLQRRFLGATGLTQGTFYQIERARQAVRMLKQGESILDTAYRAGYFDQSHMTRSLKQYIGQTPAQIADPNRTERLSFLYNTDTLVLSEDIDDQSFVKQGA
jgi:hypothetical protein